MLMDRGVGGVHHNLRAAGLAMLLIIPKFLLMQQQYPKKAVDRLRVP
jgi:hypothetical protein